MDIMKQTKVSDARKADAIGQSVKLCGWVRTRRDSKGGFSFLELNDGSTIHNIQIVAGSELPNYQSEILNLGIGSSIEVDGEVLASPGKGQETEVKAHTVKIHGFADPET
jgi:asparaginyl-tRNA synthetase